MSFQTILSLITKAATDFEIVSSTPRLDAEILMAHVLQCERHRLILHYNDAIAPQQLKKFLKLCNRRKKGEPIAYIIGYKEFYSLPITVNRHVLIPRPETELIVDCAIYYAKYGARIIDIGTGSGAIAIAIKHTRPDCFVYATDISQEALKEARRNARKILGNNTITFIHSNLFESIPLQLFDIIVSNPPYISFSSYQSLQKEIFYEPQQAFLADDNGFAIIKSLLYTAMPYLHEKGMLILEIGDDLAPTLKDYTKQLAYSVSIMKDYAGLPRIAIIKKE